MKRRFEIDLDPDRELLVIDAVRGGGRPGSIYRLAPADLDPAAGAAARAFSLHEVSVLPALRMEALAGRDFADVTIYGVEPAAVRWGEGLSEPVAAAAEKLTLMIAASLRPGGRAERAQAESLCHRE